jgi:hypothetical protein
MAIEQSSDKQLLDSVETARRHTRSVLSTNWFPMIVFGVLALVSVPVNQIWSWPAMAALWILGAPIAGIATGIWYRSRANETGVSVNPIPYVVTAIAIFVGCIAFGVAGRGDALSYAGPVMVIGLGYVAFAVFDKSPLDAVFGAATAALGVGVVALRPSHAYAVTMLFFGTGAVLLGLWNLLQSRRAR